MHHHLSQNVLFLLMVSTVVLILIHVPSSSSADDYSDCSKLFECGDIREIGYPFWDSSRPNKCGHPKFRLTCTNNVAQISLSDEDYRVLHIDNTTHTIKAVRADYQTDVCPGSEFRNTTMDPGIFNYTSATEELRLFYTCTKVQQFTTVPNQFSCGDTVNYFFTHDQIAGQSSIQPNGIQVLLGDCQENLFVRVFRSEATTLQITTGSKDDLLKAVTAGFDLSWNANNTLCEECLRNNSRCGYNHTSNQFVCYLPGKADKPFLKSNLAIGISVAVLGFFTVLAVILCIRKRECISSKAMVFTKEDKTKEFDVETFIRSYASFAPKRYSYSNVKKMTNSFAYMIGKGGYGCVYKGTLPDGQLVAVKLLKDSKRNGEDFINEVASMGRTSHVNIVSLLGFCYGRTKRALIYEYMPNGSLDKFIFNQESANATRSLEWKMSYEIALGIARGLEYLHRGCNTRILHFDIKPQNILLDKDFCPKISDFGLAKLWLNKESIVSMVGARGTAGYIAPEVFSRNFGGVSHKSDVYSYGMLVLEMVGGRKNIDPLVSHTSEIYFPYCIYEDVELGNDLRVLGVTTEEEKEISRKMVLVSFWCIQTNPSDRPPMSKVVDLLEGSLQSVQIPPKPFLFSPARSRQEEKKGSGEEGV